MPAKWPTDWQVELSAALQRPEYHTLQQYVAEQRETVTVFPPEEEVLRAFHLTPFEQVRVVILGQDPYHGVGQANGLSFSVRPGVAHPPSLRNIFKERQSDLGLPPPIDGSLDAWARQGVLLLNTVLTVREGEAHSHRKQGWEAVTDEVIRRLDARAEPVVFVLWGKPAQKKLDLLSSDEFVIQSPHPSPLSANRGFFGSRPFSTVNTLLHRLDREPLDWRVDGE